MASLNQVNLIGNLGADPECRYTANGDAVTSFNMAMNESWTNKAGAKQERTEWASVVCWRQLAEVCSQYLAKGRQVFVSGKLQTRKWDGTDGVTHYKTEVVADKVVFLGSGEGRPTRDQAGVVGGDIEPDDLPFAHVVEPNVFEVERGIR